ncbi:polysaccharide biosynthesis/export family protein [Roseobacteraceae bacterium S113]
MFNRVKYVGLSVAILSLSACGISYQSPSVRNQADAANVKVVEITPASVSTANQVPYAPKSLPAAFYQIASGTGEIGAGALPSEPFVPEESPERLTLRMPPPIVTQPYQIGVGDVVLLATKGRANTIEELSGLLAIQNQRQGFTVRDDGAISIPDVGTVELAGLTLEEAEARLFNTLVEQQIEPAFSLEIAEFNSKKIAVGGAVGRPALVPVTLVTPKLNDVLASAGGITLRDEQFGSIRLYRNDTLYQIPLSDFRNRADLRDMLLSDGDAIFVDSTYDLDRALEFYSQRIDVIDTRNRARSTALIRLNTEIEIRRAALSEQRTNFEARIDLDAQDRDYVYLTGEVAEQGRVALPFERMASLADVLFENGGFDTETGNPAEIYVLRDDPASNQVIAWHLDARNPANMVIGTKFEMRPSDVVFIEEQPITKWNRALSQIFPTLVNGAIRAVP